MGSLRARLVAVLALVALLAVGSLVVAAQRLMEDRAEQQARIDFEAAKDQLDRSLSLRYEAFRAISDLSYVLPVFRQIASGTDAAADFGLGSEESDNDNTDLLHRNLVDADWSWARQAGSQALVAVADGKGRLLYSTAAPDNVGQSLMKLTAVKQALAADDATPTGGGVHDSGAMVIDGEDPLLVDAGLWPAPGAKGLHVVLVRATLLGGQPKAQFVQVVRAKDLLADVALTSRGTHMALINPGGKQEGDVPKPVADVVLAGQDHITRAHMHLGRRWLAYKHLLRDIEGRQTIGHLVIGRDVDTGFAALLAVRNALALAALASLIVAMIAGAVFAQRLTKPVLAIEKAATKVADGDLYVQVEATGPTEIRRLADSFNAMTRGLRERQKLERTFKRYLAPEVVDYLLNNPEAQQGGQRRTLTVMFSDIAGFTNFAETRPPEEVVEILNTYLAELANAISISGGVVDKFIGDNAMGFFGAPIPRPDHAARACLAALRQLDGLQRIALLERARNWPKLTVRIGIHSGDMVVGNVGSQQTQDYTVVGDAVNLASRIEGANKAYHTQVLLTEETKAAVEANPTHSFRFREVDLVRVVGKQTPVRLFTLDGLAGEKSAISEEAAQAYSMGLSSYRVGAFADAAVQFGSAAAAAPHDGPCAEMAKRCEALRRDPPLNWDGVWSLTSK